MAHSTERARSPLLGVHIARACRTDPRMRGASSAVVGGRNTWSFRPKPSLDVATCMSTATPDCTRELLLHAIRTPLATIYGYTQLLQRRAAKRRPHVADLVRRLASIA